MILTPKNGSHNKKSRQKSKYLRSALQQPRPKLLTKQIILSKIQKLPNKSKRELKKRRR